MAKTYTVKYSGHSVEMARSNSTNLVYKVPYSDIKRKCIGFQIPNKFLVYILVGRNDNGRDLIYVGKSKNGIDTRPTAHEDKCKEWTTCYLLTQINERSFFNDGSIQYLEDRINHRIQEVGVYENTTKTTTSGTANDNDIEACDEYLSEAYLMLEILGLDLITNSEEDLAEQDIVKSLSGQGARDSIPDGIYTFSRKIKRYGNRAFHAKMEVKDGQFILKSGSEIAPDTHIGLLPSIEDLRNKSQIESGILQEDIIMSSPSACGEFITGAACNGWKNFRDKNGNLIDDYRK